MNIRTKEVYSEVYEILELLGANFIDKLPNELYELIKSERIDSYKQQFDIDRPLEEQNIKQESIDMLALFYYEYWCDSKEEKEELKKIFDENEEKYQKEIEEKYSYDKLFKKKNIEQYKTEENNITIYKESFFRKIFNKIKNLLNIF